MFAASWDVLLEETGSRSYDLAKEISQYQKKELDILSESASEVMYIYERETRRTFVETLLFIKEDLDFISEHTGMSVATIEEYGELFFDTRKIRGSLGFTEYVEDANLFHKGSREHTFGRILAEAMVGGRHVVLDQFNIDIVKLDIDDLKENITRRAIWEVEVERRYGEELGIEGKIKVTKDLMAVIKEGTTKSSVAGVSSIEALISVVKSLKDVEPVSMVELPSFNPATEEFTTIEKENDDVSIK